MIALITPTGARKAQFELCKRWMNRQTYKGDVVWIVVDDALPITIGNSGIPYRSDWTIVKIYPRPFWRGNNTQARNIKAGIDFLKEKYCKDEIEAIFIIEDDDYYKPVYLEKMMERLGNYWLLGETNTIYYNVQWRRFVTNPNRHHASLFQTAFTWETIPIIEASYTDKFIDARMWQLGKNKHLFFDNFLSIGIKGMPGRNGIGAGHKLAMAMSNDIGMNFLIKHIGNEPAKHYEGYYRDRGVAQHSRFVTKRL